MNGLVGDELYCFNLHRVRRTVTRLLSTMAMDEHHPVRGLTISDKCAIPLIRDLFSFFRRVVSDRWWPRNARNLSRFRLEAAAQQPPIVLKVGKPLDVRVHPVLHLQHDQAVGSLMGSVEPFQERRAKAVPVGVPIPDRGGKLMPITDHEDVSTGHRVAQEDGSCGFGGLSRLIRQEEVRVARPQLGAPHVGGEECMVLTFTDELPNSPVQHVPLHVPELTSPARFV